MADLRSNLRRHLTNSRIIRRNIPEILARPDSDETEAVILRGLAEFGIVKLYADAFSLDERGVLISGSGGEGKSPLVGYFGRTYPDRFKHCGRDEVYLLARNGDEPAIFQMPGGEESIGPERLLGLILDGQEQTTPLKLWVHLSSSRILNHKNGRAVIPGVGKVGALSTVTDSASRVKRRTVRESLGDIPYFNLRKQHGYVADTSVREFSALGTESLDENMIRRYGADVARTAQAVERLINGETSRFSF